MIRRSIDRVSCAMKYKTTQLKNGGSLLYRVKFISSNLDWFECQMDQFKSLVCTWWRMQSIFQIIWLYSMESDEFNLFEIKIVWRFNLVIRDSRIGSDTGDGTLKMYHSNWSLSWNYEMIHRIQKILHLSPKIPLVRWWDLKKKKQMKPTSYSRMEI